VRQLTACKWDINEANPFSTKEEKTPSKERVEIRKKVRACCGH
jgi:hypothetical protein